ncbi:MAG: hypothetical protein ABIY55_23860 [Kofleriaceae bacterium]
MKGKCMMMAGILAVTAGTALAQSWAPLTHPPAFNASTAVLLTDGTAMVQQLNSGQFWRLTPDIHGSYTAGTWSAMPSLPGGYSPQLYAGAVLADGRVIIEGGKLNGGVLAQTTQGALYDWTTNTWSLTSPPATWGHIGDAMGAVLADGRWLLGNCGNATPCSNGFQQALLDPASFLWSSTGAGSNLDPTARESFTLMPNGKVLDVLIASTGFPPPGGSEVYNPATGTWAPAGSTSAVLPNACSETGPVLALPISGNMLALGGTGASSYYNPSSGAWTAGPSLPAGLGMTRGPAAVLPNGKVLLMASPISPCFSAGSSFYELDPSTNTIAVVAPVPRASLDSSSQGRMLVLPTGQVLFTDGWSDIEIYTPAAGFAFFLQPTLSSYPTNITHAASWYSFLGTQFNGHTQGAAYGAGAQMASNYPIIRITNNATGHVFYGRTHDHSTMGIQTGGVQVSTLFDPNPATETGPSMLEVIANGIPSATVAVTIW